MYVQQGPDQCLPQDSRPSASKNSKLISAQVIIEDDRSMFSNLVGNVVPHLSLSNETMEHGASVEKCTIANISSAPIQSSGKCH